jgi:hypothetical protein
MPPHACPVITMSLALNFCALIVVADKISKIATNPTLSVLLMFENFVQN